MESLFLFQSSSSSSIKISNKTIHHVIDHVYGVLAELLLLLLFAAVDLCDCAKAYSAYPVVVVVVAVVIVFL